MLVGGGQWSNRVDRGDEPVEPVDLLAEAARRAAADTGAADPGKVLAAVESVRVVSMLSWRYRDPGRLVAERIGAGSSLRHTMYSTAGGNTPQALVNRTCRDIAGGALDVAVVGGAEAWRTRTAHRAAGTRPTWTEQPEDVAPDEVFGGELDMVHPLEMSRGIVMPVQVYPVLECALRDAAGATQEEWMPRLGRLWSRFSAVAAANPHAWVQVAYSPEEVVTPSPDNRMIGFPYAKRLNSNNAVEQGAAVLLCSVDAATRLGIPSERWVFPQSGTDGHDTDALSARRDLHSSPAIGIAGRRALELAGVGPDDVAHVDLYSCFPSAVQIAADEIGFPIDGDRELTVTGGLCFAGGPWNNYVTHSIATMASIVRERGGLGFVSANGGFVTKHAFGVYGTTPPEGGFRWEEPQAEIEASFTPTPIADPAYEGPVTLEAATVMHDREGNPELGIAAARTPSGERTWGTTRDAAHVAPLLREGVAGTPAAIAADGTLSL